MKHVTIVGTGTQGAMIAFRCAFYGKNVALFDLCQEQVDGAYQKIDQWLLEFLAENKLTLTEAELLKKRITQAKTLEDALAHCDIVIENVPERLQLKQKVWEDIDRLAPEKTIMTTNSSSLKSSDIGTGVKRKEETFNLNFAFPVRDDMVEVMWNARTSEDTKEKAVEFLNSLGCYSLVTQKEIKGFALNRVWRAVKKECLYLWANGYTDPVAFDNAYKKKYGVAEGPYEKMDKVGLDIVYDIEMSYYNESGLASDLPPAALKAMIDAGKLGKKSGEGFYRY